MQAAFKPSQVRIDDVSPFCNTYGNSEYEQIVAAFVRACVAQGDRWESLTADTIIKYHTDASIRDNGRGTFSYDLDEMVLNGHLACKQWPANITYFWLTDMDRLARWVKKQESEVVPKNDVDEHWITHAYAILRDVDGTEPYAANVLPMARALKKHFGPVLGQTRILEPFEPFEPSDD